MTATYFAKLKIGDIFDDRKGRRFMKTNPPSIFLSNSGASNSAIALTSGKDDDQNTYTRGTRLVFSDGEYVHLLEL